MDHHGVLRNARTGKAISAEVEDEDEELREFSLSFNPISREKSNCSDVLSRSVGGFGFFDVGAHEVAPQARRRRPQIGESIHQEWLFVRSLTCSRKDSGHRRVLIVIPQDRMHRTHNVVRRWRRGCPECHLCNSRADLAFNAILY